MLAADTLDTWLTNPQNVQIQTFFIRLFGWPRRWDSFLLHGRNVYHTPLVVASNKQLFNPFLFQRAKRNRTQSPLHTSCLHPQASAGPGLCLFVHLQQRDRGGSTHRWKAVTSGHHPTGRFFSIYTVDVPSCCRVQIPPFIPFLLGRK